MKHNIYYFALSLIISTLILITESFGYSHTTVTQNIGNVVEIYGHYYLNVQNTETLQEPGETHQDISEKDYEVYELLYRKIQQMNEE